LAGPNGSCDPYRMQNDAPLLTPVLVAVGTSMVASRMPPNT
jgi:hypothetical protein